MFGHRRSHMCIYLSRSAFIAPDSSTVLHNSWTAAPILIGNVYFVVRYNILISIKLGDNTTMGDKPPSKTTHTFLRRLTSNVASKTSINKSILNPLKTSKQVNQNSKMTPTQHSPQPPTTLTLQTKIAPKKHSLQPQKIIKTYILNKPQLQKN